MIEQSSFSTLFKFATKFSVEHNFIRRIKLSVKPYQFQAALHIPTSNVHSTTVALSTRYIIYLLIYIFYGLVVIFMS